MITGEHQSSSKVSVKACSLSPTQQPHRTGDDLLQQLSVQGIPRDTLSSGEFITLSSQGTEHDIMQAVYSRTSATALCCGLDSTGSRVYKSDCWVQAPNSCWPNKKLLDDLGKIYYQKSMKEFIYWKKGLLCRRGCHTHLDLATTRRSVKRKRCRSWVCRPVFSCTWPSRRKVLLWHMKDCTRGHASGLMGEKQPSLQKETEGIKEPCSSRCQWVRTGQGTFHIYWKTVIYFDHISVKG